MKLKFLSLMILALAAAGCGGGPSANVARQVVPGRVANAPAAHVFLIVEENRSYSTVYHNQMPWLSALGDKYGVATNYFSDEQGSLLDYLWLSSGSGELSFGCTGNDCTQTITDDNIFRRLIKAEISWKLYADNLPSAGFTGPLAGNYVKRHDPALWYSDVVNDPQQLQNVVPFTEFASDLASNNLPTYSIIVPDLQHDAHDGSPAKADKWLQQNIGPLVNSSYFDPGNRNHSVMFITFDNGDGDAQGQVLTVVVGQKVIPGIKVNTPFRHENTLRTILEQLGVKGYPGASAKAQPMNEFFN
ncbi:MAG TPA: alkaline phosphatase family protein [Terriglobales bacterium]